MIKAESRYDRAYDKVMALGATLYDSDGEHDPHHRQHDPDEDAAYLIDHIDRHRLPVVELL